MLLNTQSIEPVELLKFWNHIFETEARSSGYNTRYLCLFSGYRESPETHNLGNVDSKSFEWPMQVDEAIEYSRVHSNEGREVYFCAHLLKEPDRKKASAAEISALYADGDGAEVPEGLPKATAVVETSPGRKQFFWRLEHPLPPGEAEQINKRLTYTMGADRTGWNLAKLLRVPGTVNHKYEDHPSVKILEISEEVSDLPTLERTLPDTEEPKTPASGNDTYVAKGLSSIEPPVRLSDHALSVWSGEDVKRTEDGAVDRSASLLRIGRVLYDAGATRRTIVEALRERDSDLGWDKYTNRADPDYQYSKIVDELDQRGRDSSNYGLIETSTREKTEDTSDTARTDLLGSRIYLAQTISKGITPPEELIEDVLLRGKVHQIYAGAGSGKSWAALWMVNQVIARGEKVLYLDAENGERIIAERLGVIGVNKVTLDNLLNYRYVSSLPVTNEGRKRYTEELETFEPSLVIFDSWVNFLAGAELDENTSSDIAEWSTRFSRSARERGVSVVILDHVPKEGKSSRGSGRKKEEVDVQWELQSSSFDRDKLGTLKLVRRKDREGWLPYTVNFSIGGTANGFIFERSDTLTLPTVGKVLKEREVKALSILEEVFGNDGATDKEWKEACANAGEDRALGKQTYYRAKDALIDEEHVVHIENKFYPQDEELSDEDWQ